MEHNLIQTGPEAFENKDFFVYYNCNTEQIGNSEWKFTMTVKTNMKLTLRRS